MSTHATARAARDSFAASPRSVSRAAARRGLSLVDRATLFLIGLVVVLVSLPRLRRFALRENEIDAIRTLRILGADALEHAEALTTGDLGALLAASVGQRVRLEDVELVDGGRLRRHGYLFDAQPDEAGGFVLRAWPWQHGRTGLAAFALAGSGEVVGSRNVSGRWSGPASPPPLPGDNAGDRWVAVPGF